jgi:hypothetical protein
LITLSVNDALRQRLGKSVRHQKEGENILFDEGRPYRFSVVVLALGPTRQNLRCEAVTPLSVLRIAEDPESIRRRQEQFDTRATFIR